MADVEQTGADFGAMRAEYGAAHPGSADSGPLLGVHDTELDELSVAGGWEPLLRLWIEQATVAEIAEPNAMVLGTVVGTGATARPVTRTVLCKGLSPEGVIFYTNYGSAKGAQLAITPYASATFLWPQLARQAHVRGRVERVGVEVTERYWRSRPGNPSSARGPHSSPSRSARARNWTGSWLEPWTDSMGSTRSRCHHTGVVIC